MTMLVSEQIPLVEAGKALTGARMLIQIITPGHGSSGYYSAAVLEQAAKDNVFRAGTQMYIDHPTESEKWERPARTLRDLAAVLASDAYWNGSALVAEAYVYTAYRQPLLDMKADIGTSIRASAEAHRGNVDGQPCTIIDRLLEANSIDFVTKAGRGGKILQVLEAAADAARLTTSEATANDTREALQQILRDTYGAEKSWVWVRDFDDSTVWYEHETPDSCGTYALSYTAADDGAISLSGQPVEVRAQTNYVPARPGGNTTTTESQETQMGQKQIEESEFTRLTEAAGRVETLEAELQSAKTALEKATADLAEATKPEPEKPVTSGPRAVVESHIKAQEERIAKLEAREGARAVIGEVLAEAWLGDAQKARLSAELMTDLPLAEGKLDEVALRTAATDRVQAAETEAAEILKAAGVGSVRGLGAMSTPATEHATEQLETATASAFGEAFGLSESATQIAVKGR